MLRENLHGLAVVIRAGWDKMIVAAHLRTYRKSSALIKMDLFVLTRIDAGSAQACVDHRCQQDDHGVQWRVAKMHDLRRRGYKR